MKTECDVIRDLLPLYADGVCSEKSRQMVNEHLAQCEVCAGLLTSLRSNSIENGLREEKAQVIAHQAAAFKRRSTTAGSVVAGLFMIPILVCLIVNLASGAALTWFFVVLGALGVAASLILVPLLVREDRLFWTFCAFCVSLVALLAICSLYSRGGWFFTAASASLFGLSAVFLPFAVRARPVQRWIGNFSRPLLILSVDLILFANMMNMITLRTKGIFATVAVLLLCAAGAVLLGLAVKTKKGEI